MRCQMLQNRADCSFEHEAENGGKLKSFVDALEGGGEEANFTTHGMPCDTVQYVYA